MILNSDQPNLILIQASSRSWQGSPDACMTLINGKPVIEHTIVKLKKIFNLTPFKIIAPEFDKDGELVKIAKKLNVEITFSHNDSPANRIEAAIENLDKDDFFLRFDAINLCAREVDLRKFVNNFICKKLDFQKFPDDFPPQISFEGYRKETFLNILRSIPTEKAEFLVHIKHAHHLLDSINAKIYTPTKVEDSFLHESRELIKKIYEKPRGYSTKNALKVGDQLSFHYDLALKFINQGDIVLDIACGDGTGSLRLANIAKAVEAVDIDKEVILENNKKYNVENVLFKLGNGESLDYPNEHFDVITSMETIEHTLSPTLFISTLHRVLKKDGLLLISTPQNSIGHIPLNIAHHVEFSLDEFTNILKEKFEILEIIGIKSGRVTVKGSNKGQNSFIVCKKSNL